MAALKPQALIAKNNQTFREYGSDFVFAIKIDFLETPSVGCAPSDRSSLGWEALWPKVLTNYLCKNEEEKHVKGEGSGDKRC